MDPKSPLDSKTLWVNGLTLAAMLLTGIAGQEWIKAYPSLVAAIPVVLAAVNIGLRFLTTQPIAIDPTPAPAPAPSPAPAPVPTPTPSPDPDHPIIRKGLQWIMEAVLDGTISFDDLKTKTTAELLDLIRTKLESRRAA